jgi:hypothetical protein
MLTNTPLSVTETLRINGCLLLVTPFGHRSWMPTSRSEDACNLVLLAMQHFTLTRPPFVIRKSTTSLVNAGDSLAVAPNCFTIEDCHWETLQSGCKMSSSNPFLLLVSVVSSKPGKEICKCFLAFSDAKKTNEQ